MTVTVPSSARQTGIGERSRGLPLRARRPGRTTGFALVAALVLLVVLSSAGAAMVRMTGTQQAGSSIAILGTRAHWAARSGIDWALHEASENGACPAPTTTLDLGEGVLAGFEVTVSCSLTEHYEGSNLRKSLVIRSEARFGAPGDRDHVYREIQAAIVL
ncbi:MAG TPA: hypothetical protein ENI85_07580 [Deltaproteobacteria bacterium]|nr:hypothetical protein [Deltaproteobacteria bacterium]